MTEQKNELIKKVNETLRSSNDTSDSKLKESFKKSETKNNLKKL